MWSYYGSKGKIASLYPTPKFDKIIEPFAGSAKYSLKYFEKDVLLVDKYKVVADIWNYLKKCSKSDILNLPKLKVGETINRDDFDCIEQANLYGFIISVAAADPKLTVSPFAAAKIESEKKKIANQLYKIKHWKIIHGSFVDIPNENATWFIDPPYQFGGQYYFESNKKIDFAGLSDWCKSRTGQVIVCENTKATWMPFVPVISMNGAKHKTVESIWTNYHTHFNNTQTTLF